MAIAAALNMARTPQLVADSRSYLDGALTRPPVLPLLLGALGAILPGGAGLRVFDGIQAAVALYASGLVADRLAERLRLDVRAKVLLFVLLLVPQAQSVAMIASESLSYSFVCLAFASAFPLLWGEVSLRALVSTCAFSALAVATRAQFIYLALCCGALTLFVLYREKDWQKRRHMLAVCAAVPLFTLALQAIHTVPKTGHFARVALTGVQTLTLATMVSEEADLDNIVDSNASAFAHEVRACAVEGHFLPSQSPEAMPAITVALQYNRVLECIYRAFFIGHEHLPVSLDEGPPTEVPPELYVKLDTLTLTATRGIARSAWKRMIAADLSQISLWERYPALLAAALAVAGLAGYRRHGPIARLILLVAGLWWVNIVLVVALEPAQSRYTFYFDQLMVATVTALTIRAMGFTSAVTKAAPDAA